jgi:hypothetical protein
MKLPTLLSLVLLALLLSALAAPVPASPLTLYVSPSGHDSASGTQTAPLATLGGARDRLRSLKGANKLPKEGAIVWIRGGAYRLRDTFTLTGADDLSPAPMTYAAYHGEPVRLTGGQEVKGWKPVTDPAILGRLDPTARGHVLQADLKAQGITDYGQMTPRGFAKPVTPAGLELFFGGVPMTLARWPNAGQWARVAGAASDQGADHFFYEGDRPARWAQAEDAWVYGYWQFDWADSYAKVQGVDAAHHQIRAAQAGDLLTYTPGHRWYALNLLEELDTPGEWYLDRKTGVLYFWPPSDIKKGRPTVSLTRDLVRLDGVSHVTLRGLTLEACRGDAVTIRGGAHDLVDGCTIRSAGNRGATIAGATDSGVRGGEITGAGDGGVTLDGGNRKTLTPGRNFVENCRIHDYSRWDRTYRPGVGVDGVGNRVAHCLIYDAPHNAILLSGNDHRIEYNEIHHVCQQTGDAGAFYMGRNWTMRGNVVRFNYFHDLVNETGVAGEFHDVMAIYLDDTAAGTLVFGNVCVRAGHAVMVGGGRDDIVANNVFVDCKPAVSLDARGIGWAAKYLVPGGGWNMQENLAAVPYDKPPYSARYPHLANILSDNPDAPKYDVIQHNIAFRCPDWLQIQDKADTLPGITIRANLTDKDPLFVDAAHGNYQLKPGSPAFALGFQRIPFEKIGLEKIAP